MLVEKQQSRSRRITVGADKAYDTKDFVCTVRELNVTPHMTRNGKGWRSNLDRRTKRQSGYAIKWKNTGDFNIGQETDSINEALQRQLGLRLVRAKGEVLVINVEHVAKPASD